MNHTLIETVQAMMTDMRKYAGEKAPLTVVVGTEAFGRLKGEVTEGLGDVSDEDAERMLRAVLPRLKVDPSAMPDRIYVMRDKQVKEEDRNEEC